MTNQQRALLIDIDHKHLPSSADALELKKRLEVIVQEVIEAAETTMIAQDLDQYGNRYRMGTFMWARLFTSLPQILAGDEDWDFSIKSNILTLRTIVNGVVFKFNIPKVDPDNRVPTGSKGIKDAVKNGEWLYLDDGLRELASSCEPLLIGYDLTPQDGLGRVTINELSPLGGKDFYSLTIATLYDASNTIDVVVPQETVAPAKVARVTKTAQKESRNAVNQAK